jgi:hypothetical protein
VENSFLFLETVQIKVAESALKLGYYTRLDRDGTVARSYSVGSESHHSSAFISGLGLQSWAEEAQDTVISRLAVLCP